METSKGKMRPSLTRSSDLKAVESARKPTDGRSEAGRFSVGNQISAGQGYKAVIARLIGSEAADPAAAAVQRDTVRLYHAIVRELPSDGATVRQLAALQARHTALAAFWVSQATEAGLATEAGVLAAAQATLHGTRAERLAVTCLDIATKMAASAPRPASGVEVIRAQLAVPR